jgi:hypothetical protein
VFTDNGLIKRDFPKRKLKRAYVSMEGVKNQADFVGWLDQRRPASSCNSR